MVVADEKVTETEPAKGPRSNSVKPNNLFKESDRTLRPGFRNPPTERSKANKKKKSR